MNDLNNSELTRFAQALRKNMTREEKHLWYDFLKTLPFTINRQKVIGEYIVDFYCADKGIVIELDGSQHYDAEGLRSDAERDNFLQRCGLSVLRYSNHDVNCNFKTVCQDIWNHFFQEGN